VSKLPLTFFYGVFYALAFSTIFVIAQANPKVGTHEIISNYFQSFLHILEYATSMALNLCPGVFGVVMLGFVSALVGI
jgi:hypothetical protein